MSRIKYIKVSECVCVCGVWGLLLAVVIGYDLN